MSNHLLFQSDWTTADGRPRALVHVDTNNISFKRLSVLFARIGIKNHLFPLAITQKDLIGHDPHNLKDTSIELRLRIAHECQVNVWYFLREVLRIPMQGGSPIPFEAHRGNISMAWCFLAGIDYISVQPRQTGKAQTLNSRIKTPTGWTRMSHIKVGDPVIAPDGTTTVVTGVYPQGKKDVYRITFDDGRATDCCDEHLWKVGSVANPSQWGVINLQEIRHRLDQDPGAEAGLMIPLITPAPREDVNVPLDPYVVGALLGGGGDSSGEWACLTSCGSFVAEEVVRLIPDVLKTKNRCEFDAMLKSIGIYGAHSYTKQIPVVYTNASPAQKLSLIQGLMDTAGFVEDDGSVSFHTSSRGMAKQIRYIVRSLGGICKMRKRHPDGARQGKGAGRLIQQLNVQINDQQSLFRLPRKRAQVLLVCKEFASLRLGIRSVKYIGQEETQCIEVAHPDHLYITDDFIVTHNTIGAISLDTWVIYIHGQNMTIGMITKDTKLLQENVSRLKEIRDALPQWIIHSQISDTDNKEGIVYDALNNKYKTFVGLADRQAAANVGRGQSIPSWHSDEPAFTANYRIIHPVIMGAASKASVNAKLNGMPHSNIYTTTAARTDSDSGEYMYLELQKAMPFTEKLYDCENLEAAAKMVRVNSINGKINGTWSYLQLGKTHEWFVETIAKISATDEEVDRDYLNIWRAGLDTSILSTAMISKLKAGERAPLFLEVIHEDYVFAWHVPEATVKSPTFRARQMVLAMDSSDTIGRDFTALVLLDPTTMSVVATFRCNESNIIKLGIFVGIFLVTYTNTVFIPERKSTGAAIIDQVIMILEKNGFNPFLRIYNRLIQERDSQKYSDIRLDQPGINDSHHRRHLGFNTTGELRAFLYKNVLNKAVQQNAERIYDALVIGELTSLSTINGRVDHKEGQHDDLAIAYLLACWLIYEGKNLRFYGLDVSTFLKDLPMGSTALDVAQLQNQIHIKKRIRHFEALIDASDSDMVKFHFRQKVIALRAELVDDAMEPVATDQVRETYREHGEMAISSKELPFTPSTVTKYHVKSLIHAVR